MFFKAEKNHVILNACWINDEIMLVFLNSVTGKKCEKKDFFHFSGNAVFLGVARSVVYEVI